MRTRTRLGASLLLLSAGISNAQATVIYDDGSTSAIGTVVNDNIQIHNGSDVVIGTGGAVNGTGTDTPSSWSSAVFMRWGETDSSLSVIGDGRVVAGTGQNAIVMIVSSGEATVRLSDRATVVGNISTDTSMGLPVDEKSSHQSLFIEDRALVNGSLDYAGYLRLSDQAVVLGDVRASGGVNLNIDGGTIAGAVRIGYLEDHIFNMSGGAILGGVNLPASYVDLHLDGGYIGNGFRSIGEVNGEIRGGQIDGGLTLTHTGYYHMDSTLSISGGQINAALNGWLMSLADPNLYDETSSTSIIDIWGGQFGYREAGRGIFVDSWVDLGIHGRDLVYSNGWLTGFLSDGSWFNNALTFGEEYRGTFTIYNVPEPGTVALLMLGLAGIGLSKRRILK